VPDLPPADPELARRLALHLAEWIGSWPPPPGRLGVVGSRKRENPGWDGSVNPVVGVLTPDRGVLSVPPGPAADLSGVDTMSVARQMVPGALGRPGRRLFEGVFRWCHHLVDTDAPGEWVPVADPRVPEWLQPFGGEVLVAWDGEGRYAAGVGRKLHDRYGQEISVGTEREHRGRGLARRLVAQAARRIFEEGAVATYLHADSNLASAAVADASGFPDEGWRIVGLA